MSLEVKNLTIKYPYGATAVENLSFSLNKGEKLAILSPSEGGKTSLLKCLAGLLKPCNGTITLDGADITNSKPRDRDVVAIFGDEGIFPFKTVKKQLEYPLILRKIAKNERNTKVYEAAGKLNLLPLLDTLGRQLFDDDKIRLSFARMILRQSSICLIDNPFDVLKSAQRQKLFLELLPIIRDYKGYLIFSTNSVDEAFTVADKVIILNYGIVNQYDTPKNICENPKTLFVEKLLNPYNLFEETDTAITSTKFCEHENGSQSYKLVDYFYQNGDLFAILEGGIIIKTNPPLRTDYQVSQSMIRFFNISNEIRK